MAVLLSESGELFLVPDNRLAEFRVVYRPSPGRDVTGEDLDTALLFSPPEEPSEDRGAFSGGIFSAFQESFSVVASFFRIG